MKSMFALGYLFGYVEPERYGMTRSILTGYNFTMQIVASCE